jgi:hypothetical protein
MTGSRNPYQRSNAGSGRVLRALVLCLVLPPVGLFYIWYAGVFRKRGRLFMTALVFLEMALILLWDPFGFMPSGAAPMTVSPVPGYAAAVTPAPDDETINALSNIEELLAVGVSNPDTTVSPDATPRLTQEQELALKEETYNTIVYSVFRGAKYYHSSTVCGNQSNGRALTVREALAEGMGPCPDCEPPVP